MLKDLLTKIHKAGLRHILANAKAYVALAGSVSTALLGLGVLGSGPIFQALTLIAAIATAVATQRTPNTPSETPQDGM